MKLRIAALTVALAATLISTAHADFPITTNVNLDIQPQVAYNSTNQEYLVVWGEMVPFGQAYIPGRILGQRVAEDGTLLGSTFQIFSNGTYSRIAYNSALNEYLVITAPGTGVLGQRVSNTGALIGGSIALMTDQSYGRLLYNELSADYLLVAGQLIETPAGSGYWNLKIYSRRLSATGQPMGSPLFVDEIADGYGGPEPAFAVAYAPIQSPETPNGRYLMVTGRGIMVSLLNSEGAPIQAVYDPYHPGTTYRYVPFKTGSTIGGESFVDVAYGTESGYSMTGPAFFVVWADQNNRWQNQQWSGIYGGFIDANKIAYATDEEIKDNAFPVSAIADHNAAGSYAESWRPRVAYNAPAGKYMVTWRETPTTNAYNDTKVNHIRADKEFEAITMAPNDVLSATTGNENPEEPAIASSTISGKGLAAWIDYRNYGSTKQDIYATVYTIADVPPPPPTTKWIVTNTNDAGAGSLRQAILNANARIGLDTIAFSVPGSGLHSIQPTSELPSITDPVLVDGFTQSGSTPNTLDLADGCNTTLKIELNGSYTGATASGLHITGGGTTVRGLLINRFDSCGIKIEGAGGNVVEGNYIGTDAVSSSRMDNHTGILISNSPGNRIGGPDPGARNLISGNAVDGIRIENVASISNIIQGNYLGMNASGNAPLANLMNGIQINNAPFNTIGGTLLQTGNLISGNGHSEAASFPCAILIYGSGARQNIVQGNLLGTDAKGTVTFTPKTIGIYIGSKGNVIGGSTAGTGNIISGNVEGIDIDADSNIVQGNYIGTDITGIQALGNKEEGIEIRKGFNLIGGLTAGARNIISANGWNGIHVSSWPDGVNRIEGNYIGTQADGRSPLGNGLDGILVTAGTAGAAAIGGTSEGAGNIIAYSQGHYGQSQNGDGIYVVSQNVPILHNSIFGNQGLGINLAGGTEDANGVTANDPGDADTGPNGFQNYPVLSSIMGGDYLDVTGNLNSTPNSTFTLEFFATSPAYVSTGRDGQTLLGYTEVTTDASGNASFITTIGTPVGMGQSITATATDKDGNTSEFSAPFVITLVPGAEVVTNTLDSGPGSFRQAILNANAKPGRDTIAFNIPGASVHTISPTTPFPAVTDPVVIDGYTQPGSSVNTSTFSSGTNAVLNVEIDGTNAGTENAGLTILGGNSVVQGLVINRVQNTALLFKGKGGNRVEGCFVGTDASGSSILENKIGVWIDSVAYNTIGGTTAPQRNVISGNLLGGIAIMHGPGRNIVQGNYVGVNAAGTKALSNASGGVWIVDAPSNTIGGTTAGSGNVISGGGQQNGVDVQRAVGIWILGDHATGNIVAGNLIGTNADGSDSVNNYQDGVWISSKGNIVGGTAAGARNVISGNRWSGVCLQGGDSNVVQGNYIGTDIAGTKALANGHDGVWILYGTRNLIGGRSPAAGNVISGNLLAGIGLEGVDTGYSRGNRIEGNKIGTQIDGSSPLGNVGPGVLATSWSLDNAIGDTANGAANVIAFNSEDGVRVAKLKDNQNYPPDPISTLISRNSIYANAGLGINLVGGTEDSYGVTANDAGDWDTGPNDLQNCPVITSATGGNSVQIRGSLNSSANLKFTIEFFATPAEGTPKAGEGQTYLGSTTVQTDAGGTVPISTTLDVPVAPGRAITATATNYLNSTSEFSLPVVVIPTGIADNSTESLPRETALLQNYPNPFNPRTVVSSQTPVVSDVRIVIYDVLGREVAVLVNERRAAGRYRDTFDASGLASGLYIYRMTAGTFTAVKTMLLVK